jgi:hypothetical protein
VVLPEYRSADGRTQEPTSRHRQRCCLLKGCEQTFRPTYPQERYCSVACRQRARHWRRWHSSRTYRASAAGQACRRQQSRRYRERQRQERAARWEALLGAIEEQVAQEAAQLEPAEPCEGQRPGLIPEDFAGRPCQRPGCYVLLPILPSVPQQRFCSCPCRQALRRVLDRESRWRWRQRQRWRGCRPSRPPPL